MRYRIRDFLWLALAMGLGLGWYVDRRGYTRPKPSWLEFDGLGSYDPDYQYFEPAYPIETRGSALFERTPHTFEEESRVLLYPDEMPKSSIDVEKSGH